MPARIGPAAVSTPTTRRRPSRSSPVTGRCWIDVDAARRRAGRERPGDPIVAGGRRRDVMRRAEDRVAAAAGQVDLGDERA